MKGIDPKWGMYLGLLVAVEQAIGHGTVSLTNLVPAEWAPYITSWCNFLAFIGTSIMTYQAAVSSPQAGPAINTSLAPTSTVVKILIAAFLLSAFLCPDPAMAQGKVKLGPIGQKVVDDFNQTKTAVTGKSDPKAALPCMDITVLFKLTPANLVPTMKACVQDTQNHLVTDTSRALESAKNYTKTGETVAVGDSDAVNCLTPALALFQAASIVPAVPDTPAVMNADGTVKTPAVAGTPEIEPGLILMFQKYREFTISGGLTSCQAWVNGPVNATAAAGVAGAAGIIGAAALLSPIK